MNSKEIEEFCKKVTKKERVEIKFLHYSRSYLPKSLAYDCFNDFNGLFSQLSLVKGFTPLVAFLVFLHGEPGLIRVYFDFGYKCPEFYIDDKVFLDYKTKREWFRITIENYKQTLKKQKDTFVITSSNKRYF